MEQINLDQVTARALVREGESALMDGPYPERARMDAVALLLNLLRRVDPDRNRAWLMAHWDTPAGIGEEYKTWIERRLAGEPIQYITGETEFYGLPFRVTREVLIPRPETEHLVEKAIALAGAFQEPHIVDVGTGPGAIAVALAHKLPNAQVTAIDLSPQALVVARGNAARNGVSERIRFLEGDLFGPVASEPFDLIVSNPPYVAESDRGTLAVEVREFEPETALFAGEDGLDVYRRVIPAALNALVPGGYVVLEIGWGQAKSVGAMLLDAGFEDLKFTADLQGIPRVASARRAASV